MTNERNYDEDKGKTKNKDIVGDKVKSKDKKKQGDVSYLPNKLIELLDKRF